MKWIPLALLTCLLLPSCLKESGELLSYNKTYYKSSINKTGNFRVFVTAGEIKGAAIVSRFQNKDTALFQNYANYLLNNSGNLDSLIFTSPGHAQIKYQYASDPYLYTTETVNGKTVMTSTSTSRGQNYMNPYTQSFPYYASAYKQEVSDEFILSSTVGVYFFGYNFVEKHVLENIFIGKLLLTIFFKGISRSKLYFGYLF